MRRSLLDRRVPVTIARGAPGRAGTAGYLPAESVMILDRICRLKVHRASGWVLLTFLSEPSRPAEPAQWALPCQLLEKMQAHAKADRGTTFRVSGETMRYEGSSFLLLRKAIVLPRGSPAAVGPPTRPGTGSRPSTRKSTRPPATAPRPEDIMKRLLAEKPGKPLRADPQSAAAAAEPSVAPAGGALVGRQGGLVVDRLAHLLRVGVGRWLQVRFEADNTLREPPGRLLPCQLLEKAQSLAGTGGTRVRVSGEITHYKGKQYLLLRKLICIRDMGQL